MKVFKYLIFLAFFAIFLNDHLTAGNSGIDRQLNQPIIITRAPLIHRVRERLTSILVQNYEHLVYHHQHYHQHHQNYWNILHSHYYTSPVTPVTDSTVTAEMTSNATTISTGTTTSISSNSTVTSASTTTSSSTTLSPQKNSQTVTLPFFITPSMTNLVTQSTMSTTQQTSPKTESTTSTTKPTTSTTQLTMSTSQSTMSTTQQTSPKTESTMSTSQSTMSTSQSTMSTTQQTSPKTESTTSTTKPTTMSTSQSTMSTTQQTSPKTESTTSTTKPTTMSTSQSTMSTTQQTSPKTESTMSKTQLSASITQSTTPKTEPSTLQTSPSTPQMLPATLATKAPVKDPCDDRTVLYANGVALIKLCYINESMTWFEAKQKCLSIGYRLFEINTYYKEISMFNYFKVFAVNNEFHWINGIAENTAISTEWFVVDPHRVWNYTSNNWYGLVKAPVPGLCLGIIFVSGAGKFTEKDCDSFHSTFWCEY